MTDRTPGYKPEPYFLALSYYEWIELVGELIRNHQYNLALRVGWTISRSMPANREPFDRSNLECMRFDDTEEARTIRIVARDLFCDHRVLKGEDTGQAMKDTACKPSQVQFAIHVRHSYSAGGHVHWTDWKTP